MRSNPLVFVGRLVYTFKELPSAKQLFAVRRLFKRLRASNTLVFVGVFKKA
jgi:hypothetical protein